MTWLALLAFAQPESNPPDARRAEIKIVSIRPEKDAVTFEIEIPPNWHIYPATIDQELGTKTTFQFEGAEIAGRIEEPEPKEHREPGLEYKYLDETVRFRIPIRYRPGADRVTGHVTYQICDPNMCLDGKTPFTFPVPEGALAGPVTTTSGAAVPATTPPPAGAKTGEPKKPAPPPGSDEEDLSQKGLGAFLAVCVLGGLISLVMPCVYPLIPVTVTFFVKQSAAGDRARALALASMYGLGIILTFTLLGFLLSRLFGESGAQEFAGNPWVNLALTVIFFYLTLALFGAVPMELPQFVTGRVAGAAPRQGYGGAFVLGLIFSVVSFTCVIPIAASLLAVAATGNPAWALLGMFVYSATMAAPFLLFGLFPDLLKRMPKSGGWLHTVKIPAAFLELALCTYYLTRADFGFGWGLVSRDAALAVWIATSSFAALYLFGMWRHPEDEPEQKVGVVRAFCGLAFGALALYLVVGLTGRHLGAFEFLLPDDPYVQRYQKLVHLTESPSFRKLLHMAEAWDGRGGAAPARPIDAGFRDLDEYEDFEEALRAGRFWGKPLFVDFTGFN